MIKTKLFAVLFALLASVCVAQDATDVIPQNVPNDRLQRVYEATVRVSVSGGIGTGTVFHEDEKHYYILTNEHVISGNRYANIEFSKAHWPSPKIRGEVIAKKHTSGLTIDVAIVRITKASINNVTLPVIPIGRVAPTMETRLLLTCGCQAGAKPSLQQCVIVERRNNLIKYRPTSLPGRSGSALTDPEGKEILGLVAWMSGGSNSVGMAMTCTSIRQWAYDAVNGVNNTTVMSDLPEGDSISLLPQGASEIPLADEQRLGGGETSAVSGEQGIEVDIFRLFRRRRYVQPPKSPSPEPKAKPVNPLTDDMLNPFNKKSAPLEDSPKKEDSDPLESPEFGTPDKLDDLLEFSFPQEEGDSAPKTEPQSDDGPFNLEKSLRRSLENDKRILELLEENSKKLDYLTENNLLMYMESDEIDEETRERLFRRWFGRRYVEPYPQPNPNPNPGYNPYPQPDPEKEANRIGDRLFQRFFDIPIIGSILRTISFIISISIWIVFIIAVDWLMSRFFGSSWLGKLLSKLFHLISQLVFGVMSVFKNSDADFMKSKSTTKPAPAPAQTGPIIVTPGAPVPSNDNSEIIRELRAEMARLREELKASKS